LGCLVRKRQVRGFRSFENQTFTFVNNCFQNKSNEEIGVFWQALFKSSPLKPLYIIFLVKTPYSEDEVRQCGMSTFLEDICNFKYRNRVAANLKLKPAKSGLK
jgi:hypothetical protein